MKSFRFSLAAVLTLRQSIEQGALKSYASALLARQRAFARVDAIHRELGANWMERRQTSISGSTAANIEQLRTYGSYLEEELARRQAALSEAERDVSATLQRMLSARQQRQAVESLRDRQFAQHERDWARVEQKFLDEVSCRPADAGMAWKVSKRDLS